MINIIIYINLSENFLKLKSTDLGSYTKLMLGKDASPHSTFQAVFSMSCWNYTNKRINWPSSSLCMSMNEIEFILIGQKQEFLYYYSNFWIYICKASCLVIYLFSFLKMSHELLEFYFLSQRQQKEPVFTQKYWRP